ncbi:usherin-like [Glandiceps talaboti]
MVSATQIDFDYRTTSGLKTLAVQGGLTFNTWQHLAIQVYDTKLSVFINGLEPDNTPYDTQTLQGPVIDSSSATVKIGQRINGASQFVGRMQEFKFYSFTLTNREIHLDATGQWPDVHVQTQCRCPDSHPRVNPLDSRFCIRNGEPDITDETEWRVNENAHPLTFANDGDLGSYWISSFTDFITIDINLQNGQYQVFYVVLQFYSPQPSSLLIQRKKTDAFAWEDWQYFAADCTSDFGLVNDGPLATSTAINCLQFKSDTDNQIAYSKGNITFQLLAPEPVARPGYNDFYNTAELLEFVKATQVRLQLRNHYYVQFPRHGYYGIEEITVSARCNCHGHATSCDMNMNPYQCDCLPESFTAGSMCERCQPLYNDKSFRYGDQVNAYNCKPCECYSHSASCTYIQSEDPFPNDHNRGGGGVCDNCQHNTAGSRCDQCRTGYYRQVGKALDAVDVCSPCNCNLDGVVDGSDCEKVGGQCSCKQYVTGRQCDSCMPGFYNLLASNPNGCEACSCNPAGAITSGSSCDLSTGDCVCKQNVIGISCDRCNYGYKNLDNSNPLGCESCNCDPFGSVSEYCDPETGQCQCQPTTMGIACDTCQDNYYGLDSSGCKLCQCDISGTLAGTTCNKVTGQCICKANVQGRQCNECKDGFYNLQSSNSDGCTPCECNTDGTLAGSSICDKTTGQCPCKSMAQGRTCNQCQGNSWGLSANNPGGCQACDCDESGTLDLACDQNTGQCTCLTGRIGRRCDSCNTNYYLPANNGRGCEQCDCELSAILPGSTCDSVTGDCQCRGDDGGVTGRRCTTCQDGYFNFNPNTGTCTPCNCNPAGSETLTCDTNTGVCQCKAYVIGIKCNNCMEGSSNLDAGNPYGCTKSPSQQPPPTVEALDSNTVRISWQPPDEPNGAIIYYRVYRDNLLVYQGIPNVDPMVSQEYIDNGLQAYTQYIYYIYAANSAGSTLSPPVTVRTPDNIPSGFEVLAIGNVGPTSADFTWTRPPGVNGPISQYQLSSLSVSEPDQPIIHYTGLDTFVRITNLVPFTNYTFTLSVCIQSGCGTSAPVVITTPEAPPQSQLPPALTPLSASQIHVTWQPPNQPNGIITHYELFMRGELDSNGIRDPPETRLFFPAGWYNPRPTMTPMEVPIDPPATEFTATNLDPYSLYEFKVTSRNGAGTTESVWNSARTLEAAPLSMPTPIVSPVSSSVLNVSWSQPASDQSRGQITAYNVYTIVPNFDPFAPPQYVQMIYSATGDEFYYLAGNYEAYSEHQFFIEACNVVGCVNSSTASGQTLPGAPGGQSSPTVEGFNSTVMYIRWTAPSQLNGPSPDYQLQRTLSSFSIPPPRVTIGTRFPGAGYFLFPSGTILPSSYTGIEMEFKTQRSSITAAPVNALLLFAVSDGQQEEYIVLQLRNGRPWFLFDPQGGAVAITPTNDNGKLYDDGEWHHIKALRSGNYGTLTVDEVYTGSAVSPTDSQVIGETTGVYLGGLPSDFMLIRSDSGNTAVIRQSFVGCVRNVKIKKQHTPQEIWEDLDWDSSVSSSHVFPTMEGCPTQLQNGVQFLGRGHATLQAGLFTGGVSFSVSFDFRTEINSGTLLAATGTGGSFMLIELLGGNLQFQIYTAVGVRVQVITLDTTGILCNGQWKTATFSKTPGQISVTVLNGPSQIYNMNSDNLAITSELYLGGIPDGSDTVRIIGNAGITVQPGFGGCIRNLRINSGTDIDFFNQVSDIVNVNLDGCPPTVTSQSTCMTPQMTTVYQGPESSYYDTRLQVFTEYIYRVTSSNAQGSSVSEWTAGRTKEGAPGGLPAPSDPQSLSGYIIEVKWQQPSSNTGMISQYILTAYNLDNTAVDPVTSVFTDTTQLEYTGNVTGVIPFTNYRVTVTACTAGGCTESTGVNIQTSQEVPENVQPPIASAKTASSVTLSWSRPTQPNGIITGYVLYMEGSQIYSGNQMSFTQTGLSVYTNYQFKLTACTQVGCSDSETVSISTSQLPPSPMAAPTLFVQGARSIEVDWTAPTEMNGVLESYVIYVSSVSGQFGDVMYNSTAIIITSYTLEDLIPGTTYYIRVSACNAGGCTTSSASTATTVEDPPEGVGAPTVTALSPYTLYVSWSQPSNPNGMITSYSLYQNGVVVQSSMATSYTAIGLTPWSLHTYRVEACTNLGCTMGPATEARTEEAPPVGNIGLSINIINSESVAAFWSSPSQPNGFIIYEVRFTGLFFVSPETGNYVTLSDTKVLYNGTQANSQVIITGMLPYTNYDVQVRAYNTKGSLLSNTQLINMPAAAPQGVTPPNLTPISSTSIQVTWQAPARNNAPGLPVYQVVYRPADRSDLEQSLFTNPVSSTSYSLSNLTPYVEYQFKLIASNGFGSSESEWVSVYTLEDGPGPIDPPMAQVLGPYSMLITWEEPAQPNGAIVQIRLFQNDQIRESLPGNSTTYVADNLLPNTAYYFKIEVCNSAGCTASANSMTYTTDTTAPSGISPPTLFSETPTSILISWSIPQYPNGVLQGYEIERRLYGSNIITTVTIVGTSAQLAYVDQSAAITPYTTYEYRVIVKNSAGSTASEWAQITTKQALPGGLSTPVVEVRGGTVIHVSWQPPVQPNGDIISYTIRLPNPQILIANTSITEYLVEDLVPYTLYSVTIQVCTGGGCSESDAVSVTTDAAMPEGLAPPRANAITQNYISVLWDHPTRPNGPNVRYELSRMKIRQPLTTGPIFGLGFWELVSSTTDLSYQDYGLTVYTTYQYRVTVYNSIGQLTSQPSPEVTTLAGMPTMPANLTATPLDHTSVFLQWTIPSEEELQGGVVLYHLTYSNTPGVFQYKVYQPGVDSDTISTLTPNSYYEFRLAIDNGAYNITSAPAYAETSDGAPTGFVAPTVYAINSQSFRVVWQAPSEPNGDILYYRIYLNSDDVVTLGSHINSFAIDDLQPFTVYEVQVEVCTSFGCLMSDVTMASTQEAPPAGFSAPYVGVLGPNSVEIEWTAPSQPNGIIQGYDVYRRTLLPCNAPPENPNFSDINSCSYVQCRVTESQCGTQCFSGNKVCCDGSLHDYQSGYECCGSNYIPQSAIGSDVCCGGEFHTYQSNYQCCNNQYIQVLPGQICCSDSTGNGAVVDFGDACCAGIPYDTTGPQICCGGMFYDGFHAQCCGDSVISNALVCCEDGNTGSGYTPDERKQCCGSQYVDPAVTLCCQDDTGNSKPHFYNSATEKVVANDKCCGVEKISVSMQCCNNVGYDPTIEVCADRGTLGAQDCGTGTVCSLQAAATAYCNACDFDRNNYICGSVTGYYEQITPVDPSSGSELCATTPQMIYTADSQTFRYTDDGLSAYTSYEYSVTVSNSVGRSESDYTKATTDESVPEGVYPPQWSITAGELNAISLTWRPPQYPNGEISRYILIRDNVEIYESLSLSYIDSASIQPYEDYEYILRVCTYQGCTDSEPVIAATLQAAPIDVYTPVLSALSSTSVIITWQIPGQPNGVITEYKVYMEGEATPIYRADANTFSYTHSGLEAFTEYTFYISACTIVGCTSSLTETVTTLQEAAEGVQAPLYIVVSAISLEIYWQEPSKPNGVIINYRLFKNTLPLYTGLEMSFTDNNVSPGMQYIYVLEVTTQAGSTRSSETRVTMPTATPMGISAPQVTVQSSTRITAQWNSPTFPNGQITQYGLLFFSGTPDQFVELAGISTQLTVDQLTPYTLYDIRVQACNSGGCGVGPKTTVRTMASQPQTQLPPELEALGPALVQVSWAPPINPNGEITSYYILRRLYGTTQELLINIADGDVLTFRDASPSLQSFTIYEYKIRAENSEGTVESDWSQVRTLEARPSGLAPPTLSAQSSYSIFAQWDEPQNPNGVILSYAIEYQRLDFDPTVYNPIIRIATVSGDTLETTFYGLAAYTLYQVRIVAINSAGENSGIWAEVRTLEGVPTGVPNFLVEQMTDGKSILLRWNLPTSPSGTITQYVIYELNPQGQFESIYQGLTREYLFRRLEPFTEYKLVLEACTSTGCTRGDEQVVQTAEVAPTNQPTPTVGFSNATMVQLQWKPPVDPNGIMTRYDILRRQQMSQARRKRQAVVDEEGNTVTDAVVIHSEYNTDATEFSYTDTNLLPYTTFQYKVRANNGKGSVDSDWVVVSTGQAAPSGLAPPFVEDVPDYPTRLKISWSEPTQKNGILQSYLLQRNASKPLSFGVTDPKEYIDTNLQAYSVYSYTITACTAGGCTTSGATTRRTLEGAPGEVSPPNPTAVSSTAIQLTWVKPPVSFGEINRYEINVDGSLRYSGLSLQTTITGLEPYQLYSFVLVACTTGGCTSSIPVTERPLEAPPRGMNAPVALPSGPQSMVISWNEPQIPNGLITSYVLRRDGELIYDGLATSSQDFGKNNTGLTPGQEYTYVVTAKNSVGVIDSPPTTASTNEASPRGVQIQSIAALSATSIQVSWQLPLYPNGDIIRYDLLVNGDTRYTGLNLLYVVGDLQPYTEYKFQLAACTNVDCSYSLIETSMTLPDQPTGQQPPSLRRIDDGEVIGIEVQWALPQSPNGAIQGYNIYRRPFSNTQPKEESVLVTSTTASAFLYEDRDPELIPDEEYEYQVESFNSVGSAFSSWSWVKMLTAPPKGVLPPLASSVGATEVRLTLRQPTQPNGDIVRYVIIQDGVKLQQYTISGNNFEITISDLKPNTDYVYGVEACTIRGCNTSEETTSVRTLSTTPSGLAPPTTRTIGITWMEIVWLQPQQNNGPITRYELHGRETCPPLSQQIEWSCSEGEFQEQYSGMDLAFNATELTPYTRYDWKVIAYNDAGSTESSIMTAETEATLPRYVRSPVILANNSLIVIDWRQSFRLNGKLVEYTLEENGVKVYSGIATRVERPSYLYKAYEFLITMRTTVGTVSSPLILYEPSSSGKVIADSDTPWYRSVWFIAIIILVILFILFILFALLLNKTGPKHPYERQRPPLPPRQRRGNYIFRACGYAPSESVMDPLPQAPSHTMSHHGSISHISHKSNNVYVQPPPMIIAPPPLHSSTNHLIEEKTSLKYREEDDGVWDNHIPLTENGLVHAAYEADEDDDSESGHPYSFTKEQTMFTDTHL